MEVKISMQTARKALQAIDIRLEQLSENTADTPYLKELVTQYKRAKYGLIYAMENAAYKGEKQ